MDDSNIILLLFWILILAFFFAKVEINIEGEKGWAAGLPTWRIEKHWLLDIFWGGRPLTGYHVWVFSFVTLLFHTAFFLGCPWSLKLEAKVIASIMMFWIIEDFLWFILNPYYRFRKFNRRDIPWHSHRWVIFMPADYWIYLIAASLLFWYSK